jgi:glycosyltransferase involved in cell wall biosynthesis
MSLAVSLVIPVFNEEATIDSLMNTIREQTLQPAEIIFVDGGSTDRTVEKIRQQAADNIRVIEAGRAMPGKGRNIGTNNATNSWIAYTDAGIELHKDWLKQLVAKAEEQPQADIVYGNFSPQTDSFFEKCAAISYVPPGLPGRIRTKSIASCLLKKEVWEKAGGFPDFRAAEDLIFMENAEKAGCVSTEAPEAMMYWQLRNTLGSTFKKFELYSMYNVWAGRQAYWHYGIARQYIIILVFLLLGIFHRWYWWLLLPLWVAGRVVKRLWINRSEYKKSVIWNPLTFWNVMLIVFTIDMATFSGWIKARTRKNETGSFSTQ